MKYSKRKVAFIVLEFLFTVAVPVAICIMSCVDNGLKVRLGIYGTVLAVAVFYVIKKLFINRRLATLKGLSVHLKSELMIETDDEKVANIKRALSRAQVFEVLATSITPIGLLAVFLTVSKCIEDGFTKLSGTLGLILLSVVIGTVFAVLNASLIESRYGSKR